MTRRANHTITQSVPTPPHPHAVSPSHLRDHFVDRHAANPLRHALQRQEVPRNGPRKQQESRFYEPSRSTSPPSHCGSAMRAPKPPTSTNTPTPRSRNERSPGPRRSAPNPADTDPRTHYSPSSKPSDYVERFNTRNPTHQAHPRTPEGRLNIIVGWTYNPLCGSQHNRFLGGRGAAMRLGYPTGNRRSTCWRTALRRGW